MNPDDVSSLGARLQVMVSTQCCRVYSASDAVRQPRILGPGYLSGGWGAPEQGGVHIYTHSPNASLRTFHEVVLEGPKISHHYKFPGEIWEPLD